MQISPKKPPTPGYDIFHLEICELTPATFKPSPQVSPKYGSQTILSEIMTPINVNADLDVVLSNTPKSQVVIYSQISQEESRVGELRSI